MFNDIPSTSGWLTQLTMRSKDLAKVISDCYLELGRRATIALLDRLKEIGFEESTRGGCRSVPATW